MGTIRSTARILIASLGGSNATELFSSWAISPGPAFFIFSVPPTPSAPTLVIIIPLAFGSFAKPPNEIKHAEQVLGDGLSDFDLAPFVKSVV